MLSTFNLLYAQVSETVSYFTTNLSVIPADGATACTISIRITTDTGAAIAGKQVTVYTTRGTSSDTIGQPALTDSNGICTASIVSSISGGDTIWAICDGGTITQNLAQNFSFETGSDTNADFWGESGNHTRNSIRAYTGVYSLRAYSATAGSGQASFSSAITVQPNSTYRLSCWFYNSFTVGGAYCDMNDVLNEVSLTSTLSKNDWEYKGGYWNSAYYTSIQLRFVTDGNWIGTTWFDDVKFQRMPAINFVKSDRLKITTSSFTTTPNNPSPTIIIEAQDDYGVRDNYFNDTVAIAASSGNFSANRLAWSNTDTVYLSSGIGTIFFKDSVAGNPVITVSRDGLTSDTQQESAVAQMPNSSVSWIMISDNSFPADGSSVCTIVVTVWDTYGYPISGRDVTLNRTRGNSDPITPSGTQSTDANGQCTWTMTSNYAGTETVTATCDGITISRALNKNGLVAIYNFDKDANDYSGYGNNGTVTGAYWQQGKYGLGLNFTPNNYASFPDVNNSLDLTGSMTLLAWVKPDQTAGGNYTIFSKSLNSTTQNYFCYLGSSRFYFAYYGTSANSYYVTNPFTLGSWNHFALVYSSGDSTSIKFYKNGSTLSGTWSGGSQALVANNNPFEVGATYNSTSNFYDGMIDEIRIYNRALPASEILAIYNNSSLGIVFTATNLKITSSPISVTQSNTSSAITVQAQDGSGTKDSTFNSTVTLSTSSAGGKFSLSNTTWSDTTIIYLSSGSAIFYYKDSDIGNPVISVSRLGYVSDSQTWSVMESAPNRFTSAISISPISIKASGTDSATVVVTIFDTFGYPVSGRTVTLSTTRANSDPISANPQVTDAGGKCTWTISSGWMGEDTITATCDGQVIARGVYSGLVVDYTFEESSGSSTKDLSNSGNNGTLYNGPLWAGGLSGNGAQFDGVDDYVQIPANSTLDAASFTVMLWFKPDQLRIQGLIDKSNLGTSWRIFMTTTSGLIEFDYKDGAQGSDIITTSTANTGAWSHYAATFDYPTRVARVYFNGVLEVSSTGGSWGNTVSTPVVIASLAGNRFDGIIDEVKIYNRALLTQEIKSHYANSARVTFGALKLKITTPSRTVQAGFVSDSIAIEAQDNSGIRDEFFYETAGLLSSSSSGKFSASSTTWADATYITMNAGTGVFYYKDVYPDSPVVTVPRAGITSDTQIVNVTAGTIFETNSYLRVNTCTLPADGTTRCTVTIFLKDINGNVVAGKQVTLATVRGSDSTSIVQPALTDINGMCTGSVASSWSGSDTIYAICDGNTITENLIPNPSFEIGSGTDASDWSNENGTTILRSSDKAHSGNYSMRISYVWGSVLTSALSIFPNTKYLYSCYAWSNIDTGFSSAADIYPDAGGVDLGFTRNYNAWEYKEGYWTSDTTSNRTARCFIGASGVTGTAWFDDLRLKRMPTVDFTSVATKLVITSFPFTITQNNPAVIFVEAQDNYGVKITSFNGTATLSTSSSASGKFSLSSTTWVDTTTVSLSAGSAVFYFKDSDVGNPVITVSRSGLTSGTQSESIVAPSINRLTSHISVSPISVKASGVDSSTVIVTVNDTYGYPLSGKTVSITVTRGDSVSISANPQVTDANGKCTWTLSSGWMGDDTLTATCEGQVITRGLCSGAIIDFAFEELSGSEVKDSSGNNNNGILNSSPFLTSGILGKGLQFDGTDDYVNISNSASMNNPDITIMMWVNPDQLRIQGFMDKSSYSNSWRFYMTGTGGTFEFDALSDLYNCNAGSGNTIPVGVWSHIVAKYDSSAKQAKVYLNGNLAATLGSVMSMGNTYTGTIQIASNQNNRFDGTIDEVKIYNRALSDNEIKGEYEKRAAVFFSASRLKIITPLRTVQAGLSSDSIVVEAQDNSGIRDSLFVDTVTLASSSGVGKFSSSSTTWSDVSFITMNAGTGVFYYRDSLPDSPVITVSRSGFTSDTQVISVGTGNSFETTSYLRINTCTLPADGVSKCTVTVFINDITGTALAGKQVAMATARGPDSATIVQPALTDLNGMCTGSVASSWSGSDTIYAICDGNTITENLILNYSYEQGSGTDASYWSEGSRGARDSTYVHSGNYAMRISADSNAVSVGHIALPVFPSSIYKFSAWFYISSHTAGSWPFLDLSDVVGDPQIYSSQEGVWHYDQKTWNSNTYTLVTPRIACNAGTFATGWVDDVRLFRTPTIEFTTILAKLAITSSPFTITAGYASPAITIEAQDTHGYKASSFGGTVALSSSSAGGKFSLDKIIWQDTSVITLSAGSAIFYYKDSATGNPTITISRAGLDSAIQTENITVSLSFNETTSYIKFTPYASKSTGVDSITIVVAVSDSYGYPISGKSVTLASARGSNTTTISANPQTTDASGKCTWTIVSAVEGVETITAGCDGKTIRRGVNAYSAAGIWNFDTDTNDISGNNNNGTNTGGLWVTGKFGNALQFDGTNGYVNVGTINLGGNAVSVEAWIKGSAFSATANRIIDSNWWVGSTAYLLFTNESITPNATFGIYSAGGEARATGTTQLNPGQWYHLVGTFDGTTIKVYVNGTQEGTGTRTVASLENDNVTISSTNGPFNGIIDEVRIYNRTLTAEEVLASYSSTCNVKFSAPAVKLKITSSPQTIGAGIASESFTVEARDSLDVKDITFNETVVLRSSSSTGRFSPDKLSWSATNDTSITLSAGAGKFYYSDPTAGNPVITVSRTGLTSDTQIITLTATSIWETNCYFATNIVSIPADGSSTCSVTIVIRDIDGNYLGGRQVTIYSVRGDSDVIIQPGVTAPTGQCTGSISSTYSGGDTIYAICDGKTILENLIPNPSFEIGNGTDASDWSGEDSKRMRSSDKAHSGSYSMRMAYVWASTILTNNVSINANTNYKYSGWQWNLVDLGYTSYYDLSDVTNDPTLYGTQGYNNWEYKETTWNSGSVTSVKARTVIGNSAGITGTCWFDDVRLQKTPTIEFTPVATKLAITSTAFTITQNNPASVTVQAQDNYGNKATLFSETVSLTSSSAGGKFSLSSGSWVDTTIISLSSGEITFYYKDSTTGYPTITVSRTGLTSATQSETIIAAVTNTNNSSMFVSTSSAKANLTDTITAGVIVKDDYGYPIASKSVTLSSIRGTTQVSSNPQTTDANGQCTFAIYSGYAGYDTLTASCEGKTLSIVFADTFSKYTTGSDGSPVWTIHNGTWTCTNGIYVGKNSGDDGYFVWGVSAGNVNWKDYNFDVRFKTVSFGNNWRDSVRIGFRFQDSSNGYTLDMLKNNTIWFEKKSQGVSTNEPLLTNPPMATYSSINYTDGNWHSVKVEAVSNRFKVWLDGTQIFDVTDNNYNTVPYVVNGKIALSAHKYTGGTGTAEVHFDDVRVYPILNFTASKIGFGQSAFKLKAGNSSSALKLEGQGNLGGKDATLNTSVFISTDSNSGVFSANGSSWGNQGESLTLSLTSGEATFYYRDYKVGNPVLTAAHSYSGFDSSTQTETITAPLIKITSQPFTMSVTDTSPGILVSAQGFSGETDTNFNETAALSSTSVRGKFSISNTTWSDTTILRFNSGQSAFYYRDKRTGAPVLTVSNSGLGLSDNQTETITLPVIAIAKTQQNLRTDATGTPLVAITGDTVEYTITITNSGNESATGVVITDTIAFDTNFYSPMTFVSMDTSPSADSWTYTIDATGVVWQVWGSTPSSNDNVKGLRWKLNSIPASQNKSLKFRMRIK